MMNNQNSPAPTRITGRIGSWIDRLLGGTHDHFACFLPSPTGRVSAFFLERIFSGIFMGREQSDVLKSIPADAIIVYTTKYKSRFEYLFAHTRFRQLRLPVPQLAFDTGIYFWQPVSRICRICLAYLDELIRQGRIHNPYRSDYYQRALGASGCATLFLVEKKGFYRRFVKEKTDPLFYLVNLQRQTRRPIYFVPQLMFYSKTPQPAVPSLIDLFFGGSQHPGTLRKLFTLIRQPGKIFVELSQPLNLKQWLSQPVHAEKTRAHQALELRRRLLRQHNRHRQSITGPVLKSSEELKESILTRDQVQAFVRKHAESRQEPIHKVRKQADAYLDEIAAHYNSGAVRLMAPVVRWIINAMFDGVVIDHAGLARVKAMSIKGPLILVPCHKSHIDYLILSYVLYNNNMPCPHIAAGKNLSFWPLGPIFRSGGAFFLRRTFKGAVLYARIFSAYVYKLLEEGFNIALFIEGGRSRTGKLLIPKLGLISILLDAYRNGACEDLIVVPIYIGYDRIIEENAYVHEVEGGKKEDENLGQVIRARRFLGKRYGKIYINFHDPISTRKLLAESDQSLDRMTTKAVNIFCRNLGWRIVNAIDSQTVVTPHGLVAAAILNYPRSRFNADELMEAVNAYLAYANSQNAKLADTLLLNPDGAVEHAVERYLSRKILEKAPGDTGPADAAPDYIVNTAKRSLLEFYKNNCIAYFVPAAFTALAILRKDAFQFNAADLHTDYQWCRDFFKYEFAFNLERPPAHDLRKTIKSFIDDAMLMPHPTIPDCYQITSTGYRKLRLFGAFLKPYFESYRVVLNFLRNHRNENLELKDKLKKIQSLGQQMVKYKELDLIESVSKINYTNGLTYFAANGIRSEADQVGITQWENRVQACLNALNP